MTSSFLANNMDANDMKMVKNKATPTYSNIIIDGRSSTFKIFPKTKSNYPIR